VDGTESDSTPDASPVGSIGAESHDAAHSAAAKPRPESVAQPESAPADVVPSVRTVAAPVVRISAPRVAEDSRTRVMALRESATSLAAVTVSPNEPGDPAVPASAALVSALTVARRDLELQQMYGDPSRNARFYVTQSSGNCVLMATAMMIGQLTGKTPTERQIVFEAMRTPSGALPGKMMYWGLKNDSRWAYYSDAQKLLQHHGIESDRTTYAGRPDDALEALKTSLNDPDNAVLVSVHSPTIYQALWGRGYVPPGPEVRQNHAIVVLGVDTVTNTVYVNDSAAIYHYLGKTVQDGQNMAVPLEVFMGAWGTGDYMSVVGKLTSDPVAPTTWLNNSPRRNSLDPGRQDHLDHFRNS
jgi:hypothetical protein